MSKRLLITIDGPSASGKGTIAKKVAQHFNLPYLNSGALYRGLACLALERGLNLEKHIEKIAGLVGEIDLTDLENKKFHTEEMGKSASIIAKQPLIRKALFNLQRNFAVHGLRENSGAVLEGRDMGTVICPDANYKFFITASAQVRAKRRQMQLEENGIKAQYQNILNQLENRDKEDKTRANSPLVKAMDAVEIDTTSLNIEEVFGKLINQIK
jgi:cytidylate kinase